MAHRQTRFFARLNRPAQSAAALGYRMPAEFEPQQAYWLCPPHNPLTWPSCLEQAQQQFAVFMEVLARFVTVCTTGEVGIATDDSWIRDYGPIFVRNDKGELACHDFTFNSWGGKYEPREHDDVVPQHIARKLEIPIFVHDMVLEGGSIDVNGAGTVMTTEQCLLNPNRNPHLSRQEILAQVHGALGTRHVIWLPGGILGDDTDGHIDDIARFLGPSAVAGIEAPPGHPDHPVLERNWEVLKQARDQDGRPLELFALPVPEPIYYQFPPDLFHAGGSHPVPASYANFVFANQAVLVPIFQQKSDDVALRTLERALPGKTILGIRADALVVGLGAFHCLSQQQPR